MKSTKSIERERERGGRGERERANKASGLTFRGPCMVIFSHNKTNEMH
jgi:hypothetical protein